MSVDIDGHYFVEQNSEALQKAQSSRRRLNGRRSLISASARDVASYRNHERFVFGCEPQTKRSTRESESAKLLVVPADVIAQRVESRAALETTPEMKRSMAALVKTSIINYELSAVGHISGSHR